MRNAEATRERLLDAATAEFSAYGIAGARVDRIAKMAGCNKNLIYVYFGNKEALFTTILQKHLSRVYKDIVFTPDDLPGYAARIFDFAMENPDLMRLMAWLSLEHAADSPRERRASMEEKVAAIAAAQVTGQVGGAFPPNFLVTASMTLATAWTAASPFGRLLDPDAALSRSAMRDSVVKAVRLMSTAETK